MTDSAKKPNYSPLMIFGLAMALGPLTALSLGSRYAGPETLARANAGAATAEPSMVLSDYDNHGVPAYAMDKTVADILAGSGVFSEFEQAVLAAGLGEMLAGSETYTVFAPSDEAFAKMPEAERTELLSNKERLAALIQKHVVLGRHSDADLIRGETVQAMDGSNLEIGPSARFNGHVGVANAEVVNSGLYAANGIVHVIDRLIQ
jgi:uncharacterized surface protein with fasciclin (FAS1) repeats